MTNRYRSIFTVMLKWSGGDFTSYNFPKIYKKSLKLNLCAHHLWKGSDLQGRVSWCWRQTHRPARKSAVLPLLLKVHQHFPVQLVLIQQRLHSVCVTLQVIQQHLQVPAHNSTTPDYKLNNPVILVQSGFEVLPEINQIKYILQRNNAEFSNLRKRRFIFSKSNWNGAAELNTNLKFIFINK